MTQSEGMVVRADHITKRFGDVEVLRGLTFDVSAGEGVAIVGPSGAGKSTLLHVLGLLTPASGGKLWLGSREVSSLNESHATEIRGGSVGFLFQSHHLLPDLSLIENVMIPQMLCRRPAALARQRARELLTRLGLGHRLSHRPAETSGGEQQRAALARALANEPALLLADEPTGNLDRGIGRDVQDLLREVTRAHGTTLILVTHDELLAADMDRRLHLEDGHLQRID